VVGVLGFRPLLCFVGSEIYLIGRTSVWTSIINGALF